MLRLLSQIFNEFGVNNLSEIQFVIDRGANIIKALRDNNINRISCVDHVLHNVLTNLVDNVSEVKNLFECCKKVVKYFKKSNLMSQLKTTLKAEHLTRWTSKYYMCLSI